MEIIFVFIMLVLLLTTIGICLSPIYLIYMGWIKSEDVRIIELNDGMYQVQKGKFFIKQYQTIFDWDCLYCTEYNGWCQYVGSRYSLERALLIREAELDRIEERKIDERNSRSKGVVK